MERRRFLKQLCFLTAGALASGVSRAATAWASIKRHDQTKPLYGMGINIDKCIGCGSCVRACKTENGVPKELFYYRTWVERYVKKTNHEVIVSNIDREMEEVKLTDVVRSFFVPKLCNQCDKPPCVQVCPV